MTFIYKYVSYIIKTRGEKLRMTFTDIAVIKYF